MKTRRFFIATTAVVVLLLAGGTWRLLQQDSTFTGTVGVRFAGFGKGTPNAFTGALPVQYHPLLREWLSSGTNVAYFTVTNGQNPAVLVYPYVGFYPRTNATRSVYETVVTSSPNAYGIRLRPGETARIEVAILPREGAGVFRLGVVPDYRDLLSRLVQETRVLVRTRQRAGFACEWIYSDPINP